MNLEDTDNCTLIKARLNTELVSIYTNTFQHVGQKFLDSLMQQIAVQTKSQTTLLLQLLSVEEYRELSRIYSNQNKKFNVMAMDSDFSSSPDIDEPSPQHPTQVDTFYDSLQDQFLLIRSCYSNGASIESM